jgi:hypothetical protein
LSPPRIWVFRAFKDRCHGGGFVTVSRIEDDLGAIGVNLARHTVAAHLAGLERLGVACIDTGSALSTGGRQYHWRHGAEREAGHYLAALDGARAVAGIPEKLPARRWRGADDEDDEDGPVAWPVVDPVAEAAHAADRLRAETTLELHRQRAAVAGPTLSDVMREITALHGGNAGDPNGQSLEPGWPSSCKRAGAPQLPR